MLTTGTTALRLVRVARGMRVVDSAQLVGLRENLLCRMKTGDIPIHQDELEALASVYDVPPNVLKGTELLVLSTRAPLMRE